MYGENNKASRKNIPRSKALDIRSERRAQDQTLARAHQVAESEQLDAIENDVRSTKPRPWRKSPDVPLGQALARRASWRSNGEV